VARLSCDDCARYWVRTEDWSVVRRPARFGLPMLRPAGTVTPCVKCPKTENSPVRTREHAVELSEQNWQAYEFYLQCRAVGSFPEDPIVRRHAMLIRQVYDSFERSQTMEPMAALMSILTAAPSQDRGRRRGRD